MSVLTPPGWREELQAGGLWCHYCFAVATTWDHIVPKCVGGLTTRRWAGARNLIPACAECNEAKGSRMPTCRCRRCKRALAWWQRHLPQDVRRALLDDLAARIEDLLAMQAALEAAAPDVVVAAA